LEELLAKTPINMTFLTENDIKSYIFFVFVTESENDHSGSLNTIELDNIALIKSKLGNRYDTSAIFSAAEGNRHRLIVKVLTILTLYDLIRKNAARKVPEDFFKDWEWAIKWLDAVRDGKEAPTDLPTLDSEDANNSSIVKWGNNSNKDLYL
jgi:hypothetical protein